MNKSSGKKQHVYCVWGCGKFGKSPRHPICAECERREQERAEEEREATERKLKRQKHAARKQAADKDIPEPGATEPISLLQNMKAR